MLNFLAGNGTMLQCPPDSGPCLKCAEGEFMCIDDNDLTTDRGRHCYRKAEMCDTVRKCRNNHDEATTTCYMIRKPSPDYQKVLAS